MDELLDLAAIVEQEYGAQSVSLHPLNSDSGKWICRVQQANGQHWVLRAYALTYDLFDISDLTTTLLFLESQGYPAERLIRTVDNALIGTGNGWRVLVTTVIEGRIADYSLPALYLMGSMLGRLHALNPQTAIAMGLSHPPASMLPAKELAYAMECLTSVAHRVPKSLRMRYDMLVEAVQSIDRCEDLPTVIIHNDYHPANIIQKSTGQMIPIDWEGAGLGPAVIDVGFLLSSCDTEAPWTPPLPPDERRVTAIIDGYCQHHLLSLKELDQLADAMRFRAIVYGACSFAEAISEERREDGSQWWLARYNAAEEIAGRARKRFAIYL